MIKILFMKMMGELLMGLYLVSEGGRKGLSVSEIRTGCAKSGEILWLEK
ncbi:hypothetical protein GO994_16655 [Aeromonas salmonicida subsp. salmonicida]|nr:hypothetical protein GO992_07755 [Aeromonas salmonicida subsp. salmonicida]QHE48662.1 hypothetical protein GO994_16655 [Aeromonas salmonicida subsp. salmonicida]